MKTLFLIIFIFSSTLSLAEQKLRSGDVVLLSLRCYLCTMIETEEQSPYSHSGVIVETPQGLMIAEALVGVRLVSVTDFFKRAKTGFPPLVIRNKELMKRFQTNPSDYDNFKKRLYQLFVENFAGLEFDHQYRWDNKDDLGRETYYCSEFVAKFLNPFLKNKMNPKPLDFTRNWDYWFKYFHGDVPQGEWGNSPGDLQRSDLFIHLD